VFHLVSCIPQNEMAVLAGDMNGHVGSSNVGYDATHRGFGHGDRNADGSRILEFADGLNLRVCNTLFMKQESQLVTYAAGPVKSTVDYIIVRQEDKAKVQNVKVIPNEECVPKHKLLVMDMQFSTRKRRRKKFEPRVRGWKLKEEKTCEEYQNMVKDKVAEAEWKCTDVNEHWQQMMMQLSDMLAHLLSFSLNTPQVDIGIISLLVTSIYHASAGTTCHPLLKQFIVWY